MTQSPELPYSNLEMTPRQLEIMVYAAQLFHQKSYLSTSIRDISEALNITSAALYYHFKNKEEILLAIMKLGLINLHSVVQIAIATEAPDDIWNQVRAALRVHLRNSLENQSVAYVILHDLRHLTPLGREQIIAMRDSYEAMWDTMLEKGKAAGLFRPDIDLGMLTLLTFGAINLAISWYNPKGTYSPDEIADQFLQLIGTGVLKEV